MLPLDYSSTHVLNTVPATALSPISAHIWDAKYRLKRSDGSVLDYTVEDTWRRVARALALPEGGHQLNWADKFERALQDFKFLPGGRIISGSGTSRSVTLMSCYVMGTIEDSMSGIFAHLREAALTMQAGGGIGYDFSTIRPKGTLVRGVDADASGPLSFMDCWNSMCLTVMSAGERRGAMMGTLDVSHPDIEDFIDAKRDPSKLRQFNLSVLVTDAFLRAVNLDQDWPLTWQGEVMKVVSARGLWDKIMTATYQYAEPGVLFIDRINERHNLRYCETIRSSNPCFTGETLFLTSLGYKRLDEFVSIPCNIWDGEQFVQVTPRVTGEQQPLLKVELSNGVILECTPYHKFEAHDGRVLEARELEVGEKLAKYGMPVLEIGSKHPEAYTQGLFSADGHVHHANRQNPEGHISLYHEKQALLPFIKNYRAVTTPESGNGFRLSVYLNENALTTLDKGFVPDCSWDVESRLEWLAGLTDGDGCGVYEPGSAAVQISSINRDFLLRVRLMLTTLGVQDSVVSLMKAAGTETMPDGKGGYAEYPTQDCWRIIIPASKVKKLQEIGFQTHRVRITPNNPQRDASRFIRVLSVKDEGKIADKVYCFTNPISGRGCFEGIITRQCAEEPMPPYSSCLLGAVNLAALVEEAFTTSASINSSILSNITTVSTRMLDNVIDVTRFPLDKQRDEAFLKRRVGLGITGLADALTMCNVRYGSDEAIALTTQWLTTIRNASYLASAQLAAQKGRFPAWDDAFLDSPNVRELPEHIFDEVAKHGVRNGHLTAIAPTGTISLLAGNVSSGLEPIFDLRPYTRRLRQADGSFAECVVEDWAVAKWRELNGDAPLPKSFVDVNDLTPTDHVRMMGAAQGLVDAAISKTVNVPEDIPFEEFKNVYRMAYELGCKSCTTYRPNDITGSVLEAGTTNDNNNDMTLNTQETNSDEYDIKGDFCHVDPITGRHDCG